MRTFTARDWTENFHMREETFKYLCAKLSSKLRRSDSVMRKAISLEKRVAICIRVLATPTEYWTIAHLFGVARSSVYQIVHETCVACSYSGHFATYLHTFSIWHTTRRGY